MVTYCLLYEQGRIWTTLMNDELERAARVHYSFLPDHYEDDWLEVTTVLTPKGVLGGDYCSVIPLDGQRFAACICDAAGHGLASALYAARINTFVLTNILQGHDPCELISALNEFLCRRLTESGMYASFFAVILDTGSMEMQFSGAGHPAALHVSASRGDRSKVCRWPEEARPEAGGSEDLTGEQAIVEATHRKTSAGANRSA